MAGEIQIDAQDETGLTLYAQLRSATGTIWNGSALEAYLTANVADYDIALAEQGSASGYFVGDMPAVSAGVYYLTVKRRAGGGPAESDRTIGVGAVEWDGSAVVPLSSRSTLNAAGVRGAVGMASANLDTQIGTLATASALATTDAVADAIKAKTDQLNFGVAGQVDANVESMNRAEVLGSGTSSDKWRGV